MLTTKVVVRLLMRMMMMMMMMGMMVMPGTDIDDRLVQGELPLPLLSQGLSVSLQKGDD